MGSFHLLLTHGSGSYFVDSFITGNSEMRRVVHGEVKNNEGDGDPFDINYITLIGKGKYVGDGITLFNTMYAWWGEGDQKIVLERKQLVSPMMVNNRIEGENLNFENKTEGYFHYGNNLSRGWSNDMQMIWRNAKPNDELNLTFDTNEDRKCAAHIVFSKGKEYGRFQISINGKNTIINSTSSKFELSDSTINDVELKKGENNITIKILPTHTTKENVVGIDYIEFI